MCICPHIVNHAEPSEEEQSDYYAAERIYNVVDDWLPESRWLRRLLDPRYVFVDWNGAVPGNYAAVPGTLTALMHVADHGAAVLPIIGGGRPVKLAAPGNYNVLKCADKTHAGILIGGIHMAHPGAAEIFHCSTVGNIDYH